LRVCGAIAPCRSRGRALASRQPEAGAMNRRAFVTGLGGVLAAPLASEAQQGGSLRAIERRRTT